VSGALHRFADEPGRTTETIAIYTGSAETASSAAAALAQRIAQIVSGASIFFSRARVRTVPACSL
jgi:hypothetical protein